MYAPCNYRLSLIVHCLLVHQTPHKITLKSTVTRVKELDFHSTTTCKPPQHLGLCTGSEAFDLSMAKQYKHSDDLQLKPPNERFGVLSTSSVNLGQLATK